MDEQTTATEQPERYRIWSDNNIEYQNNIKLFMFRGQTFLGILGLLAALKGDMTAAVFTSGAIALIGSIMWLSHVSWRKGR